MILIWGDIPRMATASFQCVNHVVTLTKIMVPLYYNKRINDLISILDSK